MEATTMRPIDGVLARLHGARRQGDSWLTFCPVHEADLGHHNPSLQVSERPNGNVGVWCHAGCSTATVLAAIGLRFSDLYATPPPPGWTPRQ
jgi:hypothetical protein